MLNYGHTYKRLAMLAAWGFYLTGLCFGVFALTFESMVVGGAKLKLRQFSYAYYCLAAALLIWSLAAASGDHNLLKNSVYAGEAFLLLGSIFMLDIWLGAKKRAWLVVASLSAVGLMLVREHYYPPAPYLKSSVLIFNTQRPVAAVLALVFGLIWLPVNMRVARQVAHKMRQNNIASLYSSIYVVATISALIFIAARRTLIVVISFVAIGVCFLMLVYSNLLVAKVLESKNGK